MEVKDMTLRDYFAEQVLLTLIPKTEESIHKTIAGIERYGKTVDDTHRKNIIKNNYKRLAVYCYDIADGMLAVRSETTKSEYEGV